MKRLVCGIALVVACGGGQATTTRTAGDEEVGELMADPPAVEGEVGCEQALAAVERAYGDDYAAAGRELFGDTGPQSKQEMSDYCRKGGLTSWSRKCYSLSSTRDELQSCHPTAKPYPRVYALDQDIADGFTRCTLAATTRKAFDACCYKGYTCPEDVDEQKPPPPAKPNELTVPTVGIEACDTLLARFMACEAFPLQSKEAFAKGAEAWKSASADRRAEVKQACTNATAAMKEAFEAAGCN